MSPFSGTPGSWSPIKMLARGFGRRCLGRVATPQLWLNIQRAIASPSMTTTFAIRWDCCLSLLLKVEGLCNLAGGGNLLEQHLLDQVPVLLPLWVGLLQKYQNIATIAKTAPCLLKSPAPTTAPSSNTLSGSAPTTPPTAPFLTTALPLPLPRLVSNISVKVDNAGLKLKHITF